MAVPSLPNEVLDRVLCYLPLSDISSASLLSRTWQARVFPHLYNTVYLSRVAHLESFAKRIELDDGPGPLSITANLKGLVLDSKFEERRGGKAITQTEPVIDHLKTIVPRRYRLRRLCWDLLFIPHDTEIFRLFQTSCPKLDSVDLSVKQRWFLPSDKNMYTNLLKFTNLSHFSLTVMFLPYSSKAYLKPLGSLITSSPNLESLSLDLCRQDDPRCSYSPSSLVQALDESFALPGLHTFHARGSSDPDWWLVFSQESEDDSDPSDLHPLRAFFLRHPGIENLALGWAFRSEYPGEIAPADVAQLFPSLKHFEGPSFLCHAIIASSLASQLESLVFMDHTFEEELADFSLEEFIGQETTLPRLRRLVVWVSNDEGMEVWPLVRLTRAATAFEELELRSGVTNYEEFLDLLKGLPNLRQLTLNSSILALAVEHYAEEEEDTDTEQLDWEQFLVKLAKIFPRLEVIRKYLGPQKYQVWEVVREAEDECRVMRTERDL